MHEIKPAGLRRRVGEDLHVIAVLGRPASAIMIDPSVVEDLVCDETEIVDGCCGKGDVVVVCY